MDHEAALSRQVPAPAGKEREAVNVGLLEALMSLREACRMRDTAVGQAAKLNAADRYTEALLVARDYCRDKGLL